MCILSLFIAVTQFEKIISQVGEWPYLAVMCMPAELQVDAGIDGSLQVIGLMIDEQDRFRWVGLADQLVE